MTRPHHRHLRIVWAGKKEKPWIVQSCFGTQSPHAWEDIVRFACNADAEKYVKEILARDRILLGAER